MAVDKSSGDVARVREAVDIIALIGEHVGLRPAGENFTGLCPFHEDSKPSLTVSPAKQLYYCFGCGEGGNVFTFIMKMEGLSFGEALRKLAARAGIRLRAGRRAGPQERQRESLLAIVAAAADFYYENLKASDAYARRARSYLLERGLAEETIEEWKLGLAPDSWDALLRRLSREGFQPADVAAAGLAVPSKKGGGFYDRFRGRIVFPIANAAGRVIAFGGRVLGEEEPKYLNSSNTPLYDKSATLYGLSRTRAAVVRAASCVIVEGYLDLLGMWQAGVANIVATCGTALAEEAATLLGRYAREFVLLFDGDAAGQRAARRAVGPLLRRGARVRVATLAGGRDPFDVAMDGPAAAAELVEGAAEWLDFIIEAARREHGDDDVAAQLAVAREAGGLAAAIPDELERQFWRGRLAEKLGVALETFTLPAGGGARPRPSASAAGPEQNLLRLLVHYPAAAAEALAQLELGDVADEQARRVLRVMGKLAKKGPFSVVELLDELDEGDSRVVTSFAMAAGRDEDSARAVRLAVRAVKHRAFARRFRELKGRLAREGGDDAAIAEMRALLEEKRRQLGGAEL